MTDKKIDLLPSALLCLLTPAILKHLTVLPRTTVKVVDTDTTECEETGLAVESADFIVKWDTRSLHVRVEVDALVEVS